MKRESSPVLRGPNLVKALDIAYAGVPCGLRKEYSRLYNNERCYAGPLDCAISALSSLGLDAVIAKARGVQP